MKFTTTFSRGLKLNFVDGTVKNLPPCWKKNDPYYVIEDNLLREYKCSKSDTPRVVQVLPQGTIIRLWDDEDGNPILGEI